MATYIELRDLFDNSELMVRTEVATVISANNLVSGTPSSDEQRWAAVVFGSPQSEAKKALMAVLASNSAATVDQILTASDANLQTNVDDIVPTLVVANSAAV